MIVLISEKACIIGYQFFMSKLFL